MRSWPSPRRRPAPKGCFAKRSRRIERFLDTPVKRYSSGMYVRRAFAVAAHVVYNSESCTSGFGMI